MTVKLEKFEGPLSLMLKLIEKEEMDITQVSLARIADRYVGFIRANSETIQPENMADFLVIAAKLLLIKSKALLPYLYPEEEEEMEDLEQRLKMYKEFLQATEKIEKMLDKKKFMFQREFNRKAVANPEKSFSPPKKLQASDMQMVFSSLLARLRPPEKLQEKKLEKKINIEDKILTIQNLITKRIKFSFNKILNDAKNKTEVIVSFLAALELMRQREVRIEQAGLFEEIRLERW